MKRKLLDLITLSIQLGTSLIVVVASIKINKNGEKGLEDKTKAFLQRMEVVRSHVTGHTSPNII